MGKISKYSNLYSRHGELLKKVDSRGILIKYTLKEVQDLVDKLGTEKDENGNIKDQFGFNNASYILMQMYNNPKYDEDKRNFIKELNDRLRVDKEGVGRTLEETNGDLVQPETPETSVDIKPKDIQRDGEDGVDKEWEANNKSAAREGISLKEKNGEYFTFTFEGQEFTCKKDDFDKLNEWKENKIKEFCKNTEVKDEKEH